MSQDQSQGGFRVALTREVLNPAGEIFFDDLGLDLLDRAGLEWEVLDRVHAELPPAVAAEYDALLLFGSAVSAETLAGGERLRLVARVGVGYETIDVAACTRHGVAVSITPDGVRRPTATAALTLILATTQRLKARDRIACEGRWAERSTVAGIGLTGRTLGIVGFGSIGRELSRLAAPLGFEQIAHTRTPPAPGPEPLPRMVSLETLLRESDVICLCAPLTAETAGMIDAAALALVKPGAHLVNIGRGGLVDEPALVAALAERRLAGAGLDVLAQEPPDPANPLLSMDQVVVTPHSLAHNDELLRGCGHSAVAAVLALAAGERPRFVVDPAAFEHPRLAGLAAGPEEEA